MRKASVVFYILCHLSLSFKAQASPFILEEESSCLYPSSAVVYVRIGENLPGSGTAFFISPTKLLTNAHIGRNDFRVRISTPCSPKSGELEAEVISTWFDRNDLPTSVERYRYPLVGGDEIIPVSDDWALIEIQKPLGSVLGYFGLENHSMSTAGFSPHRRTIRNLTCTATPTIVQLGQAQPRPQNILRFLPQLKNPYTDFNACLIGFPTSGRGAHVMSTDSIRYSVTNEAGDSPAFVGNLGVRGGASGSPVFYMAPGSEAATAIGILQSGLMVRSTLIENYIAPIPLDEIISLIE